MNQDIYIGGQKQEDMIVTNHGNAAAQIDTARQASCICSDHPLSIGTQEKSDPIDFSRDSPVIIRAMKDINQHYNRNES